MRIRTETALTAAAALSAVAAVFSLLLFLTIWGAPSPEDAGPDPAAISSLAAFIVFAACSVMSFTARSRYLRLSEEDRDITCFRLKKAGLPPRPGDAIVPKGKMPKQ